MTEVTWINAALTAARPQAIGALLRYFRDLDTAEEAYQEACLRALQNWPRNGPPRDPTSWLILVGRNAGLDGTRRRSRLNPLPPDEAISDLDDVETPLAERLDGSQYRDDVLRLLFICCHPELPATQQIALGAAHHLRVDCLADRSRFPCKRCGDGTAHHARQGADRQSRRAIRDARCS